MFEALNERLTGVFDRITGRGALSEKDIAEAMREVRVALLEADVALPVVKDFIAFASEKAKGEEVIRSVKPADQVVKIVYDGLIEMLGGEEPVGINLNATPPAVILMAGLQGSGKTTSSAKLGEQIEVATLPIVVGESAVQITRRALQSARLQGFDVLILDTAGR
ncbi:MAG: signal recognition particle receptor subunit alpha, partial [Brevundimonas sp.]|nr:signal recognition particle receptor subunit alpha [Brevundimonas sp.]